MNARILFARMERARDPKTGRLLKGEPQPSASFARELEQGLVAAMTNTLALIFAKLLSVGCPPVRAVLYCLPELQSKGPTGLDTAKKVARQWMADALVLSAIENINGGTWHELPAETRFRLALEKNLSEAAFYLWSESFVSVEHREGLDKMKQAREMLKAALGQAPDETDPMQAFARFALELTRNASATQAASSKKAPQLQPDSLNKLLSKLPDREM